MKKLMLCTSLCFFTLVFCTIKSKDKITAKVPNSTLRIVDLFGTWANSKIKQIENKSELRTLFRPVSGFTIGYDSSLSKYYFGMQYYEQLETYTYDSLVIQNDSIIGIDAGKSFYIGLIDKSEEQISDFQLIDYGVFETQKNDYLEFSKYTDCILKCSIESFLIDETTSIFPITLRYNSNQYTIKSSRDSCSCDGDIIGLDGYSSYQIIDIGSKGTIELALYNTNKKEFEFFILEKGKENVLKQTK